MPAPLCKILRNGCGLPRFCIKPLIIIAEERHLWMALWLLFRIQQASACLTTLQAEGQNLLPNFGLAARLQTHEENHWFRAP
jgi:hypothetical protein